MAIVFHIKISLSYLFEKTEKQYGQNKILQTNITLTLIVSSGSTRELIKVIGVFFWGHLYHYHRYSIYYVTNDDQLIKSSYM